MRVVAGERKGMPLKAIDGTTTRPTTDKVKESLFNIIGPFFDGGIALDLFAGSGGLGIEALSRGAEKAIFVEKDGRAFQVLQENIKKCRYEGVTELFRTDAVRAVKGLLKREITLDYVFVDPPYHKQAYYDLVTQLVENDKVAKTGIIVCEHAKEVALPENYGAFQLTRQETYGAAIISIYRCIEEEGENVG
ncbi:16S rRNA (guanine(966)-N(2))-methyltransferase RsmD [Metasolibacillus meyeri]|uniref:16S rRNA (Guanine(966)-N(2))-methyltransferase RsmD n=1 Tax=Metasolibacillus meyeri TaxID=1071052 RepID=A0AAW9NP80_9BACL|nr:16S rRNA (guanine(966)-N(2))-methyltransferase RsmD [Metasolibacillus meyeri]MEC1179467.1 16S rRNA (guanine(966)-N(2))-methyltransferase RsmD [Metasolibacillus meyeri]